MSAPEAVRYPERRRPRTVLSAGLVAMAVGVTVMVLAVYFQRGFIPGDAIVYLAGGERLNAGHLLYAHTVGDREVGLQPPYWTVPLLSPPFIAVLFRPLALFGDAGAYAWWLLTIAVIAATLVALLRGAPIASSIALLVLAIPVVYEIGVGNVNGLILGGTVLAWVLARERREGLLGLVVAFLSALKLTPLTLGVWVVARGRVASIVTLVASLAALLCVSVAGAGIDAHLTYLAVMRSTSTVGTSDLSLAGLARMAGLDPAIASALPIIVVVVGLAATVALRRRAALSYGAAVITMVFGSPVVNINTLALLLALLAPVAFPLRPTEGPSATGTIGEEEPGGEHGTVTT